MSSAKMSILALGVLLLTVLTACASPYSDARRYTDALRDKLESLGDNEVNVQISLGDWINLESLSDLLNEAESMSLISVNLRNALPDGMLDITVLVVPEVGLHASVIDRLTDITARSGPSFVAEANDMLKSGIGMSAKILSFRAKGPANEILGWWNANPDQVRLVQSISSKTDQAQGVFVPESPIR